jgi:hypothetical protein
VASTNDDDVKNAVFGLGCFQPHNNMFTWAESIVLRVAIQQADILEPESL